MPPLSAITSPGELYAHAIAIEREAVDRYTEFAQRMEVTGRQDIAAVFRMLAGHEVEHLETLRRRTDGVPLPALASGTFQWRDASAPETPARDLVAGLVSARHALAIALDAEKRAQAFFSHVHRTAADPALRALAQEMAAEEDTHIALVERELARA